MEDDNSSVAGLTHSVTIPTDTMTVNEFNHTASVGVLLVAEMHLHVALRVWPRHLWTSWDRGGARTVEELRQEVADDAEGLDEQPPGEDADSHVVAGVDPARSFLLRPARLLPHPASAVYDGAQHQRSWHRACVCV